MTPAFRTPALISALAFALLAGTAAANGSAPPAADTLTPRLDELSAQMTTTLQRIDALQAEIRSLATSVDAHGRSIGALTGRASNSEMALSMMQKRLEADALALQANSERLAQLQAGMATAQQDLVTLHNQMAQVESALVKHSAWIAKQKMASDTASTTASEALERAVAAGKLAEGKLVYESGLSEEMTQFLPYKWDLNETAQAAIKAFAEKLKEENGNVYLEVQGHTDTSGSQSLNQKLSKQRAESVRDFLNKECGIPMHRMAAVAYGDSKPIADNSTKEGRSQNRRVTIIVLK